MVLIREMDGIVRELGRTEVICNTLSPSFVKVIPLTYKVRRDGRVPEGDRTTVACQSSVWARPEDGTLVCLVRVLSHDAHMVGVWATAPCFHVV